MPRRAGSLFFALLGLALGSTAAHAGQEVGPTADQAHRNQLQMCREGLTDSTARNEDRRRWAELLFSYRTPEATALVVELLGVDDRPDVQRALCAAIADRTRSTTDQLDPALIDPLLDLLGAEGDDLRGQVARALSDFPGSQVPTRLGALASDDDAPLVKRLAAIDALAPNSHRRAVVEQLIGLLDEEVPAITDRVVSVLAPLAPEPYGADANRWRAWWQAKSRLTEETWLAEQLGIYRDRLRGVTDEYKQFRESASSRQTALVTRMQSFQRELFRQSSEQRDTRLIEWLQDPLEEVKMTALALIRARMADEGKRPDGALLATLLQLLRQGMPDVRVAILEIVQNLSDPAVVDAILTRLERETDPVTRQAMFRALGQLKSPAALPAIVREIGNPDSHPECVREAAVALAGIPTADARAEDRRLAIDALNRRYGLLNDNDTSLKAALLNAMAGVGDASFAHAFVSAVESDKPAVLRWAIRGLRALADGSKLRRLRTLTGHADALVRLEAIEAVGELGHEEADLEPLLTRLNPTIESNSNARDAAWRGFEMYWSGRSVADRIRAAERLRDVPDREIAWLEKLAGDLGSTNGGDRNLVAVLDRLATVLVEMGRHTEALAPLRTLYDMGAADTTDGAPNRGVRLLAATLRGGTIADAVTLIDQMAAAANGQSDKVTATVADFLDSPSLVGDADRTRSVLAELRKAHANALGEDWHRVLDRAQARITTGGEPPPAPGPTDGR